MVNAMTDPLVRLRQRQGALGPGMAAERTVHRYQPIAEQRTDNAMTAGRAGHHMACNPCRQRHDRPAVDGVVALAPAPVRGEQITVAQIGDAIAAQARQPLTRRLPRRRIG